jgi:hypothetical protein
MTLRYHVQTEIPSKGWVTTAAFMAMANALHWARMDSDHTEGWNTRVLDNKRGDILNHADPRMDDEAIMRLEIDRSETEGTREFSQSA